MLENQKEFVIQAAKEITIHLMDKFIYLNELQQPPNIKDAKNIFDAVGDNYKIIAAKIGEALKAL